MKLLNNLLSFCTQALTFCITEFAFLFISCLFICQPYHDKTAIPFIAIPTRNGSTGFKVSYHESCCVPSIFKKGICFTPAAGFYYLPLAVIAGCFCRFLQRSSCA